MATSAFIWDRQPTTMPLLRRLLKLFYGMLPFKQRIFTLIRSVAPLPEKIYKHLHFKGIIRVAVPPDGAFLMHHHGHVIENELFWKGIRGWEGVSLELWVRLSRMSSVIFDIGANTGVYALVAKAANPTATVVAVEPVARVYEKLRMNVALNGNAVLPFRAAISDRTGTATLYDLEGSDHVLSVSLEPEWNRESNRLVPVEVPCMTVCDLADHMGTPPPDLLKIDVETHEPAVLRGFSSILEQHRPTMLIEVLDERVAAEITRIVDGLGYVYYDIDDVTWPPPRVEGLDRSGHFNYLLCRPEVASAIGLQVDISAPNGNPHR